MLLTLLSVALLSSAQGPFDAKKKKGEGAESAWGFGDHRDCSEEAGRDRTERRGKMRLHGA